MIMTELTPVVAAQHGAFFLAEANGSNGSVAVASSASTASTAPTRSAASGASGRGRRRAPPAHRDIRLHGPQERLERLQGRRGPGRQAALERKPIVITEAPHDYIRITSGLGEGPPVNIVVLPVLFEGPGARRDRARSFTATPTCTSPSSTS
jgi:GAF domain-containing protein